MKNNKPTCKIWATEISPMGIIHRCHAEQYRMAGQSYPRIDIQRILETTPTLGGKWELLACEANHDSEECETCQYKPWKGLSHFYDIKKQTEALIAAGYTSKIIK